MYQQEIKRDGVKSVIISEVKGSENKLLCQNICLLAKLFLDHKEICYDIQNFNFYLLIEEKQDCNDIAGYFSKENGSEEYNLACIVVFPPFQNKGYGKMLIEFSYILSRRENKIGTPERPLSDMGAISYRSYWGDEILKFLAKQQDPTQVTFQMISNFTFLAVNDVIDTLVYLGLAKYWRGQNTMNEFDSKTVNQLLDQKMKNRMAKKDYVELQACYLKI